MNTDSHNRSGALPLQESLTLADKVYKTLRDDIIVWRLEPGSRLQENHLAERFDVSRTPIREALRALEDEGLVTILPQRGAVVSELSLRGLLEAYRVRELLEPYACRMAAERISSEELERLNALLEYEPKEGPSHTNLEREIAVDREVHDIILSAVGNAVLREVVQEMRTLTIRGQFLIPHGRASSSHLEHLRIVDALRLRDGEAAEAAMQEHLTMAKQRLIR